jgi:hypothetical protein
MYRERKMRQPESSHGSQVWMGALAASLSATTNGSVEEAPGLTRGELDAVGTSRIRDVATSVSNPGNGLSAAGVGGLDVVLSTRVGVDDVLLLAAIGANPLVAQLATKVDAQDVVGRTVNTEIGSGGVATVTARELSTRDNSNGSEVVCIIVSKTVSHLSYTSVYLLGREQATLWLMDPP